MTKEYLKIIKEQGEFDFEVSSMVKELTQEEYEELKSMLITAIGTMEEMRRKDLNDQLDRELIKRARLEDKIKKATKYAHETLGFLENCFGGDDKEIRACIDIHRRYLEILEEKNEEKEC